MITVGLFDEAGNEVSYAGYERQEATFVKINGTWCNHNQITFAEYPDSVAFGVSVASFKLFSDGLESRPTLLHRSIYLISRLHLTFLQYAVRVDNESFKLLGRSRVINPPLAPLPTNCKRCNLYNEYVGVEHLVNGEYICRGCR